MGHLRLLSAAEWPSSALRGSVSGLRWLSQLRNLVGIHQQLDRPRDSRLPADESLFLQLQDHLVYRRRSNVEEPFQIGLCRGSFVHDDVIVDEGKVLTLLVCEIGFHLVCVFAWTE